MLFSQLASLLFVAGISVFAAADDSLVFAPPELRVSSGNPNTTLKPYAGNPVRRDGGTDPNVIRELLTWATKRQSCPVGYAPCDGET